MHWTIGDVRISKVVELETTGSTRFILPQATPQAVQAMDWLVPDFATPEGKLRMSIHSWIVETPANRILIDTGLGNDKTGRDVPTWNNRSDPFLERLATAGLPPDSIDIVVCTHLHVDHVGWNTRLDDGRWVPTFPNARYVFSKREYDYWHDHSDSATHAAVFADSVKPIVDAGRADLVADDHKLCDAITFISTPGHSPAHVALHVRSGGDEALFSGDVAHHPCQMAHPDWSSTADSDPAQSTRTRRDLFGRFADKPVLVFAGHFGPGLISREGDAFRFTAHQSA